MNRLIMLANVTIWGVVLMILITNCANAKFVAYDEGGQVIKYARMVEKARRYGTRIRFVGKCSSACTLYLSLPNERLCVLPGAHFEFHHAYGGTKPQNVIATKWMLKQYPYWVLLWIHDNGGLTSEIITMNYEYAKQHIRSCI